MRWPLPVNSYRRISTERLVNCYPESKPQDGFAPVALVRAPGIEQIENLGGAGRGIEVLGDTVWAVAGTQLFLVKEGSVIESIGEIAGEGRVRMVETPTGIATLNSDGQLFLSDGSTITEVTDADFRTPSDMDFLDNYLVFTETDSGRWFSSDLLDFDSYDSTYWATAEGQPDKLVGLIADHGQAFLAGIRSCEIWQNTGGTGFPFTRVDSGLLEIGCGAGESLAKADNSIFWLANDLTVRRLNGFTPFRISHDGVEAAIRGYGDVTGAYGLSYSIAGHLMYTLTFPGVATWEFDITTGLWHERTSYQKDYWSVVDLAQFGNDIYTIDEAGRVGIMRTNVYTEYYEPQRVEFTCAPMYAEGTRLRLHNAHLEMRTGSA